MNVPLPALPATHRAHPHREGWLGQGAVRGGTTADFAFECGLRTPNLGSVGHAQVYGPAYAATIGRPITYPKTPLARSEKTEQTMTAMEFMARIAAITSPRWR